MKKLYFSAVLTLLTAATAIAQTTVVTPANAPMGLALLNDELYITEHVMARLSKVNLTEQNPELTDVVTEGFTIPHDVVEHEGLLYVSDFFANTVYRINPAEENPVAEVVVEFIDMPSGLAFRGDELYIALFDNGDIVKININDEIPVPVAVVTELGQPIKIEFHGDDLYIADGEANKISKIDVTEANPEILDVITDLTTPNCLIFNGNDLYFNELNGGRILKADITEENPEVLEVVTGVAVISDFAIRNNELYMAERATNKISKVALSTLSVQKAERQKISLYPNPASNYIALSGFSETGAYTIYNMLGMEVMSGETANGMPISVQDIAPGTYFLKVGSSNLQTFIKR